MREVRGAGWVALAAALVVAAGILLPIPPQFLVDLLDSAFAATLHFGASHGYSAGTRLISTFGPLGFVYYPLYQPATFAWLVAIRALLAVITGWTVAWIGYAAWRSPWGGALAVLACAPFFASPDVWFLTLPLLAVLIELPRRRAPASLRAALGVAIGVVSLIKFTVLLAACGVLVPKAAADLLARRRVPLEAAAALLTGVLVWLATGHTASDGLRYVDWSAREISAGYAGAMQVPPDGWLVAHAVAVSLAVFAAGASLIERRLATGRRAAELALAGVLYLLFRAGFVRADSHVFITCFGLLVVAALLALLWSRRLPQRAVAAAVAALLTGGLWVHAVTTKGWPIMHFRPIFPVEAIRRLTALPLLLGSDAMTRADAEASAAIRAAQPLPALHGSVDAYSYDQAVVLAHQLAFRPRPVFQSYMAYSPRLAYTNAAFLLGADAPEWVLFRVSPIDHGLPALDDALSWPRLMTHYRLAETVGDFALLRRRTPPLTSRLEPLGRVDTQTGEAVAVPSAAGGLIWARIAIGSTRRDDLVTALLAAPLTYIGIRRGDGEVRGFRLVPALAREGFLVSPLVEDTADFVRLFSPPPSSERNDDATAITLQRAETLGIDAGPRDVQVEFFRLVIDDV